MKKPTLKTNAVRSVRLTPIYAAALFCLLPLSTLNAQRQVLSLKGEWECSLSASENEQGQALLTGEIRPVILPGSLDTNKMGNPIGEKTDLHLDKPLQFEGPAWYQRTFLVPESFAGEYVELLLERTKVTQVWINDQFVGGSSLVYAPQTLDVSQFIRPGKENTITIEVDNTLALVPVEGSHAYSPDTQTNWNGIIGKIHLTAMDPEHIEAVKATPHVAEKTIDITTILSDAASEAGLTLRARAKPEGSTDGWGDYNEVDVTDKNASVSVYLGEDAKTWSDMTPNLYTIEVELVDGDKVIDTQTLTAGLREFKPTPNGFTINGNRTFLRGKHDACVFPLTGYPAMTVEEWMREFGIAKSYGINHYRFHTFTPPEAAFEAADRMGVYLQPELPMWWGFRAENKAQVSYLVSMGKEITDAYANHASFVMFSLGNELSQERSVLKEMVDVLRAHDARPLYAQGSNNRLWDPFYAEGDDYWRSFRTGPYQENGSTDARLSMSYIDSNGEGGLLNSRYPSTTINFNKALERSPVPFLGFEVGQYQVFPNFSELSKYTGVLKPYNLELYRERLKKAGMLDQAEDFFLASGALSVLCYRADIEAMLRTERYAGFDLLDLQDYPGQGTALVGILDAFMDSKGLIRPDEFRQFCSETVILLEQKKFSWTDAETYEANVSLSNFSKDDYTDGVIEWELKDGRHVLKRGAVSIEAPAYGGLKHAQGAIRFSLSGINTPLRLDLDLFLKDSGVKTSYPVWVYPAENTVEIPKNVTVAERLDEATLKVLEQGGNVLLFPTEAAIKDHSTANQFISEFWNWQMFTGFAKQQNKPISAGTMGLLLDPRSEAVAEFPTEFHTNYQWWPIVTYSRALILDDLPAEYRPTIQVIDCISRLHKLGLVCEFKVGNGKLLVCTSRLPDHMEYPEVRQFYRSLLSYTSSKAFAPEFAMTLEQLKKLGL
ncbi:MAG: hypothetical protein JW739_06450 [Opitutales bacterium]|nr:hypothetical protein [Opitutales bacterium]